MIGCSRIRNGRAVCLLCLSCFLVVWASTGASPVLAESPTAAEFSQLNEKDQLAYLKEALLRFRRQTENFSATIIHDVRNLEYDSVTNQVGRKVLARGSTFVYDLRRIGDSYRVSRHRETHGPKKPGTIYDITDIEGYNAEAGRRKQYSIAPRKDSSPLLEGIISSHRSLKIAVGCRFFQYLGNRQLGGDIALNDPGSQFLENVDVAQVIQINTDANLVEVRFPCTQSREDSTECHLDFDLNKGALLVRRRLMFENEGRRGEIEERWDDLEVLESRQIGQIWVPTKMRITAWDSERPHQVTVHETTVKDIQLGKLTKADLEVVFPSETEVRNEITGERFKIASDGERMPSTIRSASTLTGTSSGTAKPTDQGNSFVWGIIMFNGLIVVGIIAVLIARRRHRA